MGPSCTNEGKALYIARNSKTLRGAYRSEHLVLHLASCLQNLIRSFIWLLQALLDGLESYVPIDPNRPRPYRLLIHTKMPEVCDI